MSNKILDDATHAIPFETQVSNDAGISLQIRITLTSRDPIAGDGLGVRVVGIAVTAVRNRGKRGLRRESNKQQSKRC
jgi:hypothetical protein